MVVAVINLAMRLIGFHAAPCTTGSTENRLGSSYGLVVSGQAIINGCRLADIVCPFFADGVL